MRIAILALGLSARVASEILWHYSSWLLAKVLEASLAGLNLAIDAVDFSRWLVDDYVHRWCGNYSAGYMN